MCVKQANLTVHQLPKNIHISGFTLIELVVGMLVFAVALTFFSGMIVPQATRSIEPIFQVRATELAQSLINEISAKAFDEQSSRNGSHLRCGESGALACTGPANLGPDNGEGRSSYNDVDDYNDPFDANTRILNGAGNNIVIDGANLYEGFSAKIRVTYDSNMDGQADNVTGNTKLITVIITTPSDEALVFASYRSNF